MQFCLHLVEIEANFWVISASTVFQSVSLLDFLSIGVANLVISYKLNKEA
jgi:hypothetical protein